MTEGTYDERRYIVNGERPGEFKKHDYVTGKNEVGSPPDEVENDLAELIEEVNAIGAKAPLKAGAYLHARFENIHPFADGNGRVGRTLLNYWLMINNYPPTIVYEEDRRAYYDALQDYDEQEDLTPLVQFLEAQTVKTWSRSTDRQEAHAAQKAELVFAVTLDARQETLSSEGVFFYVCTSGLLLTTEGFRANAVHRAYCFLLAFSV